MLPSFSLLLITDRRSSPLPLPDAVAAALSAIPAGAAAVQLREKDLGGRALAELGRALLPICRARSAPLLVNDRIDVCLALGADGVHLARTSVDAADARALLGPGRLVGISCHSAQEVQQAQQDARGVPDYALFGPIFETASKRPYGPPLGTAALAEAAKLGLPLYAVGCVTAERVPELASARGLAAIGSALGSPDPAAAVAKLWRAIDYLRPSSIGT
ncbi:MAG: thiamine phosphate synthase [Myxococcales bacterium]